MVGHFKVYFSTMSGWTNINRNSSMIPTEQCFFAKVIGNSGLRSVEQQSENDLQDNCESF